MLTIQDTGHNDMNEKIKQLAEQANLSADKTYQFDPKDGFIIQEWDKIRLEKFAELIIQECCDIFVELRTRPADLAVKDVKKHFEIK